MSNVPDIVFIVPYRDRLTHMKLFIQNMTENILLTENYEIYFAHQKNKMPFNRGGMKNIGFLAIKNKYPEHYKNITFVFNDVDTYPSRAGLINYNTVAGIVKHFYGYTYALGGIFSIKGGDFERVKGFPNFWGWGIEDNVIHNKCLLNRIRIDRTQFFKIGDKQITQHYDGHIKTIAIGDSYVFKHETPDDITHLKNIYYTFDETNNNNKIIMIDITNFECLMKYNEQIYSNLDLIKANNKIKVPNISQLRRNANPNNANANPNNANANPNNANANPNNANANFLMRMRINMRFR